MKVIGKAIKANFTLKPSGQTMYESYFGLSEKPFSIVPDTRFLYLSKNHREAIAHLAYAINEKNGFVQLTGEVGLGKTMVCRYLLSKLPEDIDVALILNPRMSEVGLLKAICTELKIKHRPKDDPGELTIKINKRLLYTHSQDRQTLLIIDEAQNIPNKALEQVRLLTNLETDQQKLMRIVLIGQPELGERLNQREMRQVAQRITSRYHFSTLSRNESDEYIKHRLAVAGCTNPLFTKGALKKIFKLTKGTPRLINLVCDRALIGAFSLGIAQVDTSIVKTAAKEALPLFNQTPNRLSWVMSAKFLLVLLLLSLLTAATLNSEKWLPSVLEKYAMIHKKLSPQEQLEPPTAEKSKPVVNEIAEDKPKVIPANSMDKSQIKLQADRDFRLGIPGKEPSP